MNGLALRVPVVESSQVAEARRAALVAAARAGFAESETGRIAVVVTELATNLVKHGASGEVLICDLDSPACKGLEILALDKGPGMENIAECLRDGYSTAGSRGSGMGAISRLSDSFAIYSQPGKGTALAVCFVQKRQSFSQLPFAIGGISVALRGERVCGDAWTFHGASESATVLAVDGLGHGLPANDAARGAVDAFEHSPDLSPVEHLDAIHRNIRSTRGAAAAIAHIDFSQGLVRYAGVGNLSGVILTDGAARHMVSLSGTLGHGVRMMRTFEYAWPAGATLVLHSDGVSARWDIRDYPGLLLKPPSLIAGVLYRDLKRDRDDATVVVLKQGGDV